jgi:hypothetical protein
MTPAPKGIWTYAYRLDPPQSAERLRAVKALLEHERAEARGRSGTWDARLVTDERVTDILVVSDSPHADRPVNVNLERALRILGAGFERTTPLAVDAAPVAPFLPRKK